MLETKDPLFVQMKTITLEELVAKKDREVIQEELIVKVHQVRDTDKVRNIRKVVVGDCKHTSEITFWKEDIATAGTLQTGDVISIKNFSLNFFNIHGSPPNMNYRSYKPISVMKKDEILKSLKDLITQQDADCVTMTRTLIDIDEAHEYLSCPGKDGNCGKKVNDGQKTCLKPKCGLNLEQANLFEDYRVTLVIRSDTHDLYKVTAFRKKMIAFEVADSTVSKKLINLMEKKVQISAQKSFNTENDPILSALTML